MQSKTPGSADDLDDIDALLKEIDQSKKPTKVENRPPPQPQKPTKKTHDFSFDDFPPPPPAASQKYPVTNQSKLQSNIPSASHKGNQSLFSNFDANPESKRPSILKQPPKPKVEDSFDIDAILYGRSIHPPPGNFLKAAATHKNAVVSPRKPDFPDWLSDDGSFTGNEITRKKSPMMMKDNPLAKPITHLNPDDFFANASNNRESSATKPPYSTSKPSARDHYLGKVRYKPGEPRDRFLLESCLITIN